MKTIYLLIIVIAIIVVFTAIFGLYKLLLSKRGTNSGQATSNWGDMRTKGEIRTVKVRRSPYESRGRGVGLQRQHVSEELFNGYNRYTAKK